MGIDKEKAASYIKAKKKVKNIKFFYVHLLGYVLSVLLICYNLYIIEEGPYKDFFIWFDIVAMIIWGLFILMHAWSVFKGRLFFKKSWELKKIEQFMKEENESTTWE